MAFELAFALQGAQEVNESCSIGIFVPAADHPLPANAVRLESFSAVLNGLEQLSLGLSCSKLPSGALRAPAAAAPPAAVQRNGSTIDHRPRLRAALEQAALPGGRGGGRGRRQGRDPARRLRAAVGGALRVISDCHPSEGGIENIERMAYQCLGYMHHRKSEVESEKTQVPGQQSNIAPGALEQPVPRPGPRPGHRDRQRPAGDASRGRVSVIQC